MTTERWLQVYRVFRSALQRDAAERQSYFDQACAGASSLHKEVAELLAHHGRASGASRIG